MSNQSLPASSAVWHPVLPATELPAGEIRAVEVAGRALVVIRAGDAFVVLDRACPHQEGDLAAGRLVGNTLKCPLHGYMFSLQNGRGLNCRGYSARQYAAQVTDGVLEICLQS
jgi:nitrite reductase/ring-hydroxylating ferredoxin subunit